MQVEQVAAEGLRREFKITVPSGEIEDRVRTRLERMAKTVRLPGFRPGKAPLPLLRKQYGRAILGEVLQEAVDEGSQRTIGENDLRPALRPQIEVTSFDEGKDLEFGIKVEVLPEVPTVQLGGISLTRLVAETPADKVEEAIANFAKARQKFEAPAEPRPAQDDDQLTIDFEGKIDGVAFEGGASKGFPLGLGSQSLVPGFEEQLIGAVAGETREVKVTFPADYARAEVAGKDGVFTVTVHEIKAPVPYTLDDAWAEALGFENLAEVKETFEKRFADDYRNLSRARLKRALLDRLAADHVFPVPQGMVDLEFDAIWSQLTGEMQRTGGSFGEGDQSEEALRAEYRKIAERRVRLGLVLSDIGNRNGVRVENEELQQAVLREAMRFPGDRRQFFEFVRNNQAALEQIRAPLFEDKVCDFIFGQANVTEQPVTVEELIKDPDEAEAAPAAA